MKSFADGTLGSRTAWMDTPWTERAQGWPLDHTAEGTLAVLGPPSACGGARPRRPRHRSAAVAAVLDAFESAEIVSGRVEHAQFVRDVDLPRFQGHWCSMQPTHHVDDAREIAKWQIQPWLFDSDLCMKPAVNWPFPAIGPWSQPIRSTPCLKPFGQTDQNPLMS